MLPLGLAFAGRTAKRVIDLSTGWPGPPSCPIDLPMPAPIIAWIARPAVPGSRLLPRRHGW